MRSERKNIQINYCPNCRGNGFDRGETDKIIEKSVEFVLDKYTDSDENHTPAIRRICFNVPSPDPLDFVVFQPMLFTGFHRFIQHMRR
ncbi:zf-TFIIB domain-containing protein [Yersinia artesiana]|uniref:zf-TFIIB domain-containing protein n=1 Tax=Yersinia artesiana TaxID=2890315 RepID=UPI0015843A69|nr:zf-TFIIB domain-containing protein [Yersinia artesiana]